MHKKLTGLYFSALIISVLMIETVCAQGKKELVVKRIQEGPIIDHKHADVIASGNKSGFETGQVVKIKDVYHMFVNEMFGRAHLDMRIAYWTSTNTIDWKRESTIVESVPGRSADNLRSEVWVTAVEFNEEEQAWNIFYVAYRGGDKARGELEGYDYAGRIWRAKSMVAGRDGIAGPYVDMGIVLQPDANSQSWEGQQAIAAFNPYRVGDGWYAFYDGHNHVPQSDWPLGMAKASQLSGPWTRLPEGQNPIPISAVFNENVEVTELKAGGYLAIFDSFGDHEIGYSLSDDGIHWAKERRLKVQSASNLWADAGDHATRTPLGAIEEEDGSFTVVYTARYTKQGKVFFGLGQVVLGWE